MNIKKDGKGQKYIDWFVGEGGGKRAWIQHREPDKDWANALNGRYLNVARIDEIDKGPAGNATDFPIFNNMPDEQILKAFVFSVSSITGRELEDI
ncbi:hypothetical protein [Candidatus Spongiihabitans sp.]|uniref:hypothetical protein n=1 Tax=Candidatus Spongiihabitans sp. TaxID=3101308 RepID=UPI003C7AC693